MCSRPVRPLGFAHLCRTPPAAPFTRCFPRSFTFYVTHPIRSIVSRLLPRARPLLPFPIAVPGFLGALAALGTSRRKVNSHQRLAALPAMSLAPVAPFPHSRRVQCRSVTNGKTEPNSDALTNFI